jgi:hypothetical protein
MKLTLARSGEMRMSAGRSFASEISTFCSVRMLIICCATPSAEESASRGRSGVPTFTAMITSAPISRATSTGRFRNNPPSPRSRPPTCAGAKAPGIDIEARMATVSGTSSSTTCLPVSRSVATARKRIGKSFSVASLA